MKKIIPIRPPTAFGAALLCALAAAAFGQSMAPYCCAPPYVTTVVPPNIMISLDNSGSMFDPAYSTATINITDTVRWYGYFKPESLYNPTPQGFQSSLTGVWPGKILNWACMSRADVAKKVLTGGKGNVNGSVASLLSEGRSSWTRTYRRDASNYNTLSITHSANATYVTVTRTGANPPINSTLSNEKVKVDIPEPEYRGVLDQIGDKDDDRHWDDEAPIFGLWHYNESEGGHVRDYIGDPDIIDMRNHINDIVCDTWTPLAENYFELLHYFSQNTQRHYYNSDYTPNAGGLHDPWYDKRIQEMVPCRRSFVLMITDGESTMDQNIPNSDAGMPNCTNLQNYWDGVNPTLPDQGTDWLDDITLYGHVNDMRPDAGWGNRSLSDNQEITCFIVYAFGTIGSNLLRSAAMTGGFEDKNGNNLPDLRIEWDENNDSIPDNYYEAKNGYEMEEAIMRAIMEMLARISSGSGAAVITQGGDAGGITAQGQFYPRRYFGTEVLDWTGNLYTLWLDSLGLMREDSDSNDVLNNFNDLVIKKMFFNGTGVSDSLFRDVLGNGESLQFHSVVPIENIKTVWDGGKLLWNTAPATRTIQTFTDINKNNRVDAGEIRLFNSAHAAILQPYLGVATAAAADTIIRYVRGEDFLNLRTRTAATKVWKLGDIISSTPVAIGAPMERYDYIYGDMTYFQYWNTYETRRPILYVGANDGLLHAFNAGRFNSLTGELEGLGRTLGEELWAYIPYNLLPHLRWLKSTEYCHVYYVDMKTYISDARIFTPDNLHINGWGTVLIGAMRLGGGQIITPVDTCKSSYFMIDITDPLSPTPLWEFHDDSLNFTACYSAIMKVGTSWFLALTSGPMTCGGECTRSAKVYILDLTTGALLRKFTLDANSFITNIFGLDWNQDYIVEFLYFGTVQKNLALPGGYGGKIYRINTLGDTDPDNWTCTLLMDMQRPVTGEGSVTRDINGNRWVFFGTGRFFSDVDEGDLTQQMYVGFRDDTLPIINPMNLYNVTGINVDTTEVVHLTNGTHITFDSLVNAVANRYGWYRWLDIADGERSLTTTLIYGGAVFFTSFAPQGDICSYGGQGFLYALYYRTGTAYKDTIVGKDGENNRYVISMGGGMPSEPAIYLNKIILQRAGEIDKYDYQAPEMPRTGLILWKGR